MTGVEDGGGCTRALPVPGSSPRMSRQPMEDQAQAEKNERRCWFLSTASAKFALASRWIAGTSSGLIGEPRRQRQHAGGSLLIGDQHIDHSGMKRAMEDAHLVGSSRRHDHAWDLLERGGRRSNGTAVERV